MTYMRDKNGRRLNSIAVPDTGELAAAYVAKGSVPLNPLDYGVIGDGSTDDSAAINALLAGLTAGQTVDFGNRSYRVTNLVVSGKSDFHLIGRNAKITTTSSTVASLQLAGCTNFTVRGLTIIGTATSRNGSPNRGISIEGCTNFRIEDNDISGVSSIGILVKHTTVGNFDGVITGNRVHDNFADGIGLYGYCKRITISNNIVRDTGDDTIAVLSFGADADYTEDISVVGNVSYHSGSRGIAVAGARNVTVSGNSVRDPKYAGIYVAYDTANGTKGTKNVSVVGNTVYGANSYSPAAGTNYAGIHVSGTGGTTTPVQGVSVVGNTVDASAWHGILVGNAAGAGVYDVLVEGNVVRNSGADGLIFQTVTGIDVRGNRFNNSASHAIEGTAGATGVVTVTHNSIRDISSTVALLLPLSGATQGEVSGNQVLDTTGHMTTAISVASSANLMVYGNYPAAIGTVTNPQKPVTTSDPFDYLAPNNVIRETIKRTSANGFADTAALTSGTLSVQAIPFLAGETVSTLRFQSGTTALASATNQWACILDSNLNVVAVSSDLTTATWVSNVEKSFTLNAAWTCPANGLYYIGLCVVATTVPTLRGGTSSAAIDGRSPIITGKSSTGLTAPPTVGTPMAALTAGSTRFYAGAY